MKIENINILEIHEYKKNAKKHDEIQINNVMQSIKEFGMVQPLVIDQNNTIIIGHCRFRALKRLKWEEVPCLKIENLSEKDINKLRLLDNKLNESEWDFDLLFDQIGAIDWNDFDIDWGLDDFLKEDEKSEIIEDEVPDVEDTSISQVGDIYILGKHRLICGDSTDENVIKKLMNNKKADMIFTDPPYNMQYCGDGFINEELKNNVRNRIKDIIDFDAKSISYLASGNYANSIFIFTSKDLIKDYLDIFSSWAFNLLVWHKTNTPPMVNNNFFSDTEYLLYFHKGKRVWNNGLKPIDVYKKYFVTSISEAKKEAGENFHPTMKPLTIISNEVRICSNKKGIVLDLFGGSGSTLIACEQLNRRCFMCELSPNYVDVIVKRYIDFTNNKNDVYVIRDGQKIKYSEI